MHALDLQNSSSYEALHGYTNASSVFGISYVSQTLVWRMDAKLMCPSSKILT